MEHRKNKIKFKTKQQQKPCLVDCKNSITFISLFPRGLFAKKKPSWQLPFLFPICAYLSWLSFTPASNLYPQFFHQCKAWLDVETGTRMDKGHTGIERSEVSCLYLQKIMAELVNERCPVIFWIELIFKHWEKLKKKRTVFKMLMHCPTTSFCRWRNWIPNSITCPELH